MCHKVEAGRMGVLLRGMGKESVWGWSREDEWTKGREKEIETRYDIFVYHFVVLAYIT